MLNKAKIIAFIPTRNAEKSKAFYEGVLGLRFVSDDKFAMVFDANGTMIRIARVPPYAPAQFTIMGWEVTNIAEVVVAGLQNKGVNFEKYDGLGQDKLGIWSAPGGAKVAWFKDPDGNILSLSEHN